MQKLKIVFFGTPEFAVGTLKALVEAGENIIAVVTALDKPAGRGLKLTPSAVKQYAVEKRIPVIQPSNLKDPQFIQQLQALAPDLQIIVAFRMLPEAVWNLPRLGTVNLHASLLPQYRGAAPINRAIMNGETVSGVSTFFLTHAIDTGAVIAQEKVPVLALDNAGTYHDKLMHTGAKLMVETVLQITSGNIHSIAQNEMVTNLEDLKNAPKLFKPDCAINWNQSIIQIHNQVRGLSPYPTAFFEIQDESGAIQSVKVFESCIIDTNGLSASDLSSTPRILTDQKSYFHIKTSSGTLGILDLQLTGKKRMPIQDFLRGFKITPTIQIVTPISPKP